MKLPFWRDPNESIEILEPNDEAANKYGHNYGAELVVLNDEHLTALKAGKMLAWNDSEYSTFVILESAIEGTKAK